MRFENVMMKLKIRKKIQDILNVIHTYIFNVKEKLNMKTESRRA